MKPKFIVWSVFVYIMFANVLIPLLSPLRVMQIYNAASLRNTFLPVILLAIVVSAGFSRVLAVRSNGQAVLLFGLLQAALVGLPNLLEEETIRPYFSHVFQLGSAYAMFGVGYFAISVFKKNFWLLASYLTVFASGVASFFTISYLESGGSGRLYTPAYNLILPVAVFSVVSPSTILLPLVLLPISNKRAPIIAILVAIITHFSFGQKRSLNISKRGRTRIVNTLVLLFAGAGAYSIVSWASSDRDSGMFKKAVIATQDRIEAALDFRSRSFDLDRVSAGRVTEIEAALSDVTAFTWLFGNGAGSTFTVYDGNKRAQNIHVSPVSMFVNFGLPVTVCIYGLLLTSAISSIRIARSSRVELHVGLRVAPYYVLAALVHSIFAYSIFIDLLTFFFVGSMSRQISDDQRNTAAVAFKV